MPEQRDERGPFPRVFDPDAPAEKRRDAIDLEKILGGVADRQALGRSGLDDEREKASQATRSDMSEDPPLPAPGADVGH